MVESDRYLTIGKAAETEIKIKGSRFVARAESCSSESAAEDYLAAIRKKYYDATHHCFAYRVGIPPQQKFRYSDAGEPSGTAGKPIYDRVLGNDLTDTIIVVTRYFGGTKLGTGGLTHAYSQAAGEVIEKAGVQEKFVTDRLAMVIPFPDYNIVERLIYNFRGKIAERDMSGEAPRLSVEIRKSRHEELRAKIVDATAGRVRFE